MAMYKFWRLLLATALCSALGLSVFSCAKKSSKPVPAEYLLYVASSWGLDEAKIFIIDTEVDSIIDSMVHPGHSVWVAASPDGRYFSCSGYDQHIRVYHASDYSFAGELGGYWRPIFAANIGEIVSFSPSGTTHQGYDDFSILHETSIALHYVRPCPSKDYCYGTTSFGEGNVDSTRLTFYDLRERQIAQMWPVFSRPGGGGKYYSIFRYHLSPDGSRFYAIATSTGYGPKFFCYDLPGDSVAFEVSRYPGTGYVQVSPDGREVWVTDPGVPSIFIPTPGMIFIYDAHNGSLLHEISLRDLDTVTHNRPEPLYAFEVRFHPTKPKAYVGCGGQFMPGPVLVINTETYEIIKWFLPDFKHIPLSIDIGPKP